MPHYVKTTTAIFSLLILMLTASAQKQISHGYTEIKKQEYDACSRVSYLIANTQIKKQSGKLTFRISAKTAKVFNDDESDKNFCEFEYMGDIKETKLSLVKRSDYNNETFYLVNRSTGIVDTLIGPPVFANNMRDFACINNPGTDQKQRIQVCEIKDGAYRTRVYLNGKADTLFAAITCVNRNFFLAKDNKGKYWKLDFKTADK